jgi:hypothetical protein
LFEYKKNWNSSTYIYKSFQTSNFSKILSAGAELIYFDRERERELERESDRRIGTAKIKGDILKHAKVPLPYTDKERELDRKIVTAKIKDDILEHAKAPLPYK